MERRRAERGSHGVDTLNNPSIQSAISFHPHTKAQFISRPNRFLVLAQTATGPVKVHCPNPGRLREILHSGCELFLEKSDSPGRKTSWTLAAARYGKQIIPLVSVRANQMARELLFPRLYPDFAATAEVTHGKSRFDWMLKKDRQRIWVEVKACTLVEQERAMFPDAPSVRAVKHLNELIEISQNSSGGKNQEQTAVLFLVMNPDARIFSPNPHTDPSFCKTLSLARNNSVSLRAASLKTLEDGSSHIVNENLDIDLSSALLAEKDEGVLVRIWKVSEQENPKEGLWSVTVEAYRENLSREESRKPRIPDHLPRESALYATLPIRGSVRRLEAELANLTPGTPAGEYMGTNPLTQQDFLGEILRLRHRVVFE